MAKRTIERHARIAGQDFRLRSSAVARTVRTLEPEPIASHFVVIGDRRFPPKQVISAVTGLDRADFTTHQARRTLMRLGFRAGRRGVGGTATMAAAQLDGPAIESLGQTAAESLAERLHPLAGQWVAVKDDEIIYSATTPHRLVGWLGEHGRRADSMFRVPEDELAATGLAPL